MYKIAVCDDNPDMLARLSEDLRLLSERRKFAEPLEIMSFASGSALLDAVAHGDRFHIILLDILMPLMDGMETAAEIRRYDKSVKIIFLTTSTRFALESYDVKAYGYLIKGGPQEKLYALLNEAIAETSEALGAYTLLKTKTGLEKFFFHSIEYVEILGKVITLHLNNGEAHEMYGSLSQIEPVFAAQVRFIKPHRSFLVNMDYIRRLHNNEIFMVSGCRIPVAKASYGEIKERYISYSFSGRQSNAGIL
ncbi:MAG: response regulator transcription factor [Clostridiales bacterium]|nr:response regulator transcription factor [Clostridiales bacterium]